jgi:hypothetical protein
MEKALKSQGVFAFFQIAKETHSMCSSHLRDVHFADWNQSLRRSLNSQKRENTSTSLTRFE